MSEKSLIQTAGVTGLWTLCERCGRQSPWLPLQTRPAKAELRKYGWVEGQPRPEDGTSTWRCSECAEKAR